MITVRGLGPPRLAGFLLGAALAATLVLASRPASGGQAVGATLSFSAEQTGELAVDPAAPATFIEAPELRPGDLARGSLRMRNQTGRREAVRLRLVPSSHELDRILRVEIRSGNQTIASGPLGSMAGGAGDPIVLAPGAQAGVCIAVSLPADYSDAEAAAELVEVAVTFETRTPQTSGAVAR